MSGMNDLAAFGPSLGGYRAALRLLVSRLRTAAGDIHSYRDPSVHFTGRWVDAPGEKVTFGPGSFTWRSPTSSIGGNVAFIVVARQGFGAGTRSRSTDDPPVRSIPVGSPPAPRRRTSSTPVAYRVTVPAGTHVIRCRIDDVQRGANLVGWERESPRTGFVVLVEQPRLRSYAAYQAIHAPFIPSDRSVLALNRTIAAVAAEFDDHVITVDADRVIGGQPRYFQADGLQPTAAGDRRIAASIESAVAARRAALSSLH